MITFYNNTTSIYTNINLISKLHSTFKLQNKDSKWFLISSKVCAETFVDVWAFFLSESPFFQLARLCGRELAFADFAKQCIQLKVDFRSKYCFVMKSIVRSNKMYTFYNIYVTFIIYYYILRCIERPSDCVCRFPMKVEDGVFWQ